MSTRYEWGNLAHPFLSIGYVPDGGCAADHDGPCGDCSACEDGQPCPDDRCGDECLVTGGAIVLGFDEAMVIEGSTDQLRALARTILRLVPDEGGQ